MALSESGTAKESLDAERLTKVLDSDLWQMLLEVVSSAETLQDKSDECRTIGGLASFLIANSEFGFWI